MSAVADHYLNEKVATATPAELIGMLFDKALTSLKQAQRFLSSGQHLQAVRRINNARDIVLELRCVLNPAAGELTVRLDALYVWVIGLLRTAAAELDTNAVQDALNVLEPLQSAWREACLTPTGSPTDSLPV